MKKLRLLFLGFVLMGGALAGAPMPPQEFEELLQKMNDVKAVQVIDLEASNGDGTPNPVSEGELWE